MNKTIHAACAAACLASLSLVYSATAGASCASYDATAPANGAASGFIRTSLRSGPALNSEVPSIVGLWRAKFLAPNGALVDDANVMWHADGTEIMNSGRAPITQSFCMGTWVQTGRSTFKLHHYAKSWDNTGSVYVGPADILEVVTVDSTGTRYTGTFSITQYAIDEKTVLGGVSGTISATRLTAN
jgi:hypothetical protein